MSLCINLKNKKLKFKKNHKKGYWNYSMDGLVKDGEWSVKKNKKGNYGAGA